MSLAQFALQVVGGAVACLRWLVRWELSRQESRTLYSGTTVLSGRTWTLRIVRVRSDVTEQGVVAPSWWQRLRGLHKPRAVEVDVVSVVGPCGCRMVRAVLDLVPLHEARRARASA